MLRRRTATSVAESEGLRCRVRAVASPFLFLVAQDRKLSLSGSLGWAEEALKRHVWNCNGDEAIEVSSVGIVFFLVCSVFEMIGRSSRAKNCLAATIYFLKALPPGYVSNGLWAIASVVSP